MPVYLGLLSEGEQVYLGSGLGSFRALVLRLLGIEGGSLGFGAYAHAQGVIVPCHV